MSNFTSAALGKKAATGQNTLIVHYAEIGLKKGNRRYFENLLVRNIRTTLGSELPCAIRKLPGRFAIFPQRNIDPDACVLRLAHVFGIASIANSTRVEPDIDAVRETVLELVDQREFESFAVRARRSEKKSPMSSQEVNMLIGSAVERATGARVDLTSPDLTIYIELLKNHAFVYTNVTPGPGGLPLGASGHVACLISGGIDSPVAAWRMKKRGCFVSFIHFHSEPFTTSDSQDKVVSIVEHLLKGQPRSTLTMVPFGEIQKKIVISVPKAYRVLMYRRFMIRIACALAKQQGVKALVTGEALAQVASQTLANMAAIEATSELPILRPLLGLDKDEIVREAKRIGTFDISIQPHNDCCSFLTPRHPVTKSSAQELADVEHALDVDALVSLGLEGSNTKKFSRTG